MCGYFWGLLGLLFYIEKQFKAVEQLFLKIMATNMHRTSPSKTSLKTFLIYLFLLMLKWIPFLLQFLHLENNSA